MKHQKTPNKAGRWLTALSLGAALSIFLSAPAAAAFEKEVSPQDSTSTSFFISESEQSTDEKSGSLDGTWDFCTDHKTATFQKIDAEGTLLVTYSWDPEYGWSYYDPAIASPDQPFPADGIYQIGSSPNGSLYYWNLKSQGNYGLPVSGYVWNEEKQAYDYFLSKEDIATYSPADSTLPPEIFEGFQDDISRHSGLVKINGNTYYIKSDGTLRKNYSITIDGVTYFFDENGVCTNTATQGTAGWIQDSKGWRYWLDDNTYLQSCWKIIDGKHYCFDTDGYRRNREWYQENDNWYYFQTDGAMAKGKLDLPGGKSYFLDLKTGIRLEGFAKGKNYYFYGKPGGGELLSGWQKIDEKWYYFYPKSKAMATGKITLSGKTYFLDTKNGQMKEGFISGAKYRYYGKPGSGELLSGWQKIDGKWYYFYPKSKAMATGLKKIGKKWYYLDPQTGIMKTGRQKIGDDWYYLKSDGSVHTGWLTLKNTTYYIRKNGKMYVNEVFTVHGLTAKAGKSGAVTMQSKAADSALRTLNQTGWNLRAAFNWSAGLTYYRPTPTPGPGVTHSEFYANYGYQNRMGNCYVMAATFYYMAKILGYDVYFVEGQVPLARGGFGPHGWTEIIINGTTYVFDPNFTNETGRNGYQIYYGMSGTWRYTNYRRVR